MQQALTVGDLLSDARNGSERAFETLVGPLIEPAYRFASGMLHDPQAAQDAVQEATLKAWRKLDRVHGETSLRSWFLGIVKNECRNARRLKWASVTLGLPADASAKPDASVVRSTDIRNALQRLPDEDRAVVVLFFYLDLPLDEVARAAGCSESAARSRLYRAIRKMRPDLDIEEALK